MSRLLDTSGQPNTPGLRSTRIRESPRIHELMLKPGASWLYIDVTRLTDAPELVLKCNLALSTYRFASGVRDVRLKAYRF